MYVYRQDQAKRPTCFSALKKFQSKASLVTFYQHNTKYHLFSYNTMFSFRLHFYKAMNVNKEFDPPSDKTFPSYFTTIK